MASPYAFVTLLTSDYYLPGVLTLAAALSDIHPSPVLPPEVDFQTVCLVTPETVDVASIKLLRKAFDVVVGVEIIEEDNERGLQLLGMCSSTWFIYHLFLYASWNTGTAHPLLVGYSTVGMVCGSL
jgi:glycogenin glucosyltransferase